MAKNEITRYAFLNPTNALIEVSVNCSKDLIAGGEFKIYNAETRSEMYSWKMSAKNNTPVNKIIKFRADDINKCIMIWQFLICALETDVESGSFYIELLQDKKKVKTTIPMVWQKDNIPPCKIKSSIKISESLTFIKKV